MTARTHVMRALGFVAGMAAAWLLPTNVRAQDSPSPSPAPSLRVAITLLGHASEALALQEVTAELLARERFVVAWADRASFRPQDIFERGPEADEGAIAVWIDLSEPGQARLYFHDARADRFFLRSLPLSRGIDELAKEEIAHVVANAVLALSRGSDEALTRIEARTALQVPPVLDAAAAVVPARHALQWSAALLVGGQLFADEQPLVARASALLTVAHRLPGHRASALGGWADFGYQLAADHRDSLVGARVSAMAWRAGLLFASALPHRLLLALAAGAGVERIHYSPEARSEVILLAPASSFYVPLLTFWAGLNLNLAGGLALTVHLGADVPLKKVHFDLDASTGEKSRVFELYALRPGVALGLVYGF